MLKQQPLEGSESPLQGPKLPQYPAPCLSLQPLPPHPTAPVLPAASPKEQLVFPSSCLGRNCVCISRLLPQSAFLENFKSKFFHSAENTIYRFRCIYFSFTQRFFLILDREEQNEKMSEFNGLRPWHIVHLI